MSGFGRGGDVIQGRKMERGVDTGVPLGYGDFLGS